MTSSRVHRFHAVALTFALGGALAAPASWAATPAPAEPAPAVAPVAKDGDRVMRDRAVRHEGRHGHHEWKRHGGPELMIPGAGLPGAGPISPRLLKELSLDDAQTQRLEDARKAQRTLRDAHRDTMAAAFKLRSQQLEAGKLDPRAMLQAQQDARVKQQADVKVVQDKWLALWDSLTSEQQAKVVQHLKTQDERRERRMQRHRDRAEPQA